MKSFCAKSRVLFLAVAVLSFLSNSAAVAGNGAKPTPIEIQAWHSRADELPGFVSPGVLIAIGVVAAATITAIIIANNSGSDSDSVETESNASASAFVGPPLFQLSHAGFQDDALASSTNAALFLRSARNELTCFRSDY
jgi:hypothetical protein